MGLRDIRNILDDAMEVIEETSKKNVKEKKDITDIVREWEQERGLEPSKLPEQKKSRFTGRSNNAGAPEDASPEAVIGETLSSKPTEKPLDDIMRERLENPIELECPKCGSQRSFDRLAGFIKCESCGAAETLHPSHFYDSRLDSSPKGSKNDAGDTDGNGSKRTKAETLSLASIILGVLGIVFLGAGGMPECTSVVLAEMVLKSPDATPKDRRCARIGVVLSIIGILEMCLLLYLDTAKKRL